MSFQENKKGRSQCRCSDVFCSHAFHPKAVNTVLYRAGLLARSRLITFPFAPGEQWSLNQQRKTQAVLRKAYSYGDSAGLTPDFPFNPAPAGTKYAANVGAVRGIAKSKHFKSF